MKRGQRPHSPGSRRGFLFVRGVIYASRRRRFDERRVLRLLPGDREVPAAASWPHGGPLQVRIRIGPPDRGDRQRPVLASEDESLHGGRALSDDRSCAPRRGDIQFQHSSGGGSQPLFRMGLARRVHVPSVQEGVHQQPDDPPAVRGGRVRGVQVAYLQQGLLFRDGDPQEDGGGRGLEDAGPGGRRPCDRRHRRRRKGQGLLRGGRQCAPPRFSPICWFPEA